MRWMFVLAYGNFDTGSLLLGIPVLSCFSYYHIVACMYFIVPLYIQLRHFLPVVVLQSYTPCNLKICIYIDIRSCTSSMQCHVAWSRIPSSSSLSLYPSCFHVVCVA